MRLGFYCRALGFWANAMSWKYAHTYNERVSTHGVHFAIERFKIWTSVSESVVPESNANIGNCNNKSARDRSSIWSNRANSWTEPLLLLLPITLKPITRWIGKAQVLESQRHSTFWPRPQTRPRTAKGRITTAWKRLYYSTTTTTPQ